MVSLQAQICPSIVSSPPFSLFACLSDLLYPLIKQAGFAPDVADRVREVCRDWVAVEGEPTALALPTLN